MAKIAFTECREGFERDHWSRLAESIPVLSRVKFYESILERFPVNEFRTLDENFILVAQWMRRKGKLKELTLISVCGCGGEESSWEIQVDDEGDMLDEPHHGFFGQRLKYLR